MLTNLEIRNIIPHRYPFLLVDKIIELEPGKRAIGIKNVTANEPFFQGHFPEYPIMPGVLIVEALAQTAGIAANAEAALAAGEGRTSLGVCQLDEMKFNKQLMLVIRLRLELKYFIPKWATSRQRSGPQ